MKRVTVNVELYIYVPMEVEEQDLKDIAAVRITKNGDILFTTATGYPLDKIEFAGGKVIDKRFQ